MKNVLGLFLTLIFCIGYSANSQSLRTTNQKNFGANSNYRVTPVSKQVKLYSQMSEAEKNQFISEQSDKILANFGRSDGDKVNEKGLKLIREFVDGYVKKASLPKSAGCANVFRTDLSSILMRGSQYVKTISDEFSAQNLVPQAGVYTAMIESEFCPCLQAPTGALGMFQFTVATGTIYGLKTVKGSTSQNPDDRCKPQLAARAAAKYMKFMITDKFNNQMNSIGYPLAIASYNSGEGSTLKHIKEISDLNGKKTVTFWDFVDNLDKTGNMQFKTENFKYIPKFFAAAIIGENPRVFGVDIEPLSKAQ